MKSLLVIGGLPLLIYPFVALASVMSLAGHTDGTEPVLLMMVARGFQITSLLYPVVYVSALIASLSLRKTNESIAFRVATVPLLFLALTVALFSGWMALDRS